MKDRPYRSFRIDELEAIVTKNWNAPAALRKAYRTQNHPDKHSGDNKNEAEEAFKEMESIFDVIEGLRK
jgi:DnaJ-class molecular chaperone